MTLAVVGVVQMLAFVADFGQLLLGRHRVVPGVEGHSHSSAPFLHA